MNKIVSIIFFSTIITGCVSSAVRDDDIDRENGWVKIYSTSDMVEAQNKANHLCGHSAFYLKHLHEADIKARTSYSALIPSSIPFQCDVYAAAKAGNLEAQKQAEKLTAEAYNRLDSAKQHQYEVHKEYARKHGGDSFSTVNPDGSIEAHSFDGAGSVCHASVTQYGSEAYCE